MKTYSEREIFTVMDVSLFQDATRLVSLLPDRDSYGRELRCHEVARAVAMRLRALRPAHALGIEVVDGRYEIGAEHSWLTLASHHILDVYTVGRLPPVQLIARVPTLPSRYAPSSSSRTDVHHSVVEDLLVKLRDWS